MCDMYLIHWEYHRDVIMFKKYIVYSNTLHSPALLKGIGIVLVFRI